MLFNQLYYKYPYQKEFDAVVRTCIPYNNGYAITLDQTLFYPEGGGEPSDTGTLNGVPVLDVQILDDIIVHFMNVPIEEGTTVHGEIDWKHRFHLMQCHTAEHIVSGLIHQKFGYENVGFHMNEVVTLDLNGPVSMSDILEIERQANRIVYENVPVLVLLPNESELATLEYRSKKELTGQVRIIKIPGADSCACCGMHVAKTGEIGSVKLLSLTKYKGGVRIEMTAGYHAMLDYQEKHEKCVEISRLLSVKQEDIIDGVKKLKEELSARDQRIAMINRQLFELKTAGYDNGLDHIIESDSSWSPLEIRIFCETLRKADKAAVNAVLSGNDEDGYYYCISSNSMNLKNISKQINECLNGRGGGSPRMIQGTFHAPLAAIRESLSTLSMMK